MAFCYTPAMSRDFYAVLGVSREASAEDIKKAYRKLSKELHPDKHKGDKDREQKFKEINEAYETLSDPKKRQMYDQFGSAGPRGGGGGFGGFDFSGFSGAQSGEFGGFSDLFESFFGGGGNRAKASRERGRDLELRVRITFAQSVTGMTHTVSLDRFVPCSACEGKGAEKGSKLVSCAECSGTGQVVRTAESFFGVIRQNILCTACSGSGSIPEKKCATCDGDGRVRSRDTVSIDIPAGIADGQSIRLRGMGEAAKHAAPTGDLFVRIEVTPDLRFTREGEDIHSSEDLSVVDAILGVDKEIQTVHGSVSLRIPAGTQPGQVFRLKGSGMPVVHGKTRGDHYVTLRIVIPSKLSREERKLIEEWKNISS